MTIIWNIQFSTHIQASQRTILRVHFVNGVCIKMDFAYGARTLTLTAAAQRELYSSLGMALALCIVNYWFAFPLADFWHRQRWTSGVVLRSEWHFEISPTSALSTVGRRQKRERDALTAACWLEKRRHPPSVPLMEMPEAFYTRPVAFVPLTPQCFAMSCSDIWIINAIDLAAPLICKGLCCIFSKAKTYSLLFLFHL